MKKIHPLIIVLLTCSFLTTHCKKGENDPVFSLLTRKQRLVGDWRMSKGSAGFTSVANSVSYLFTYDGTGYTANETPSGQVAYIYKGHYLLTLSFKKDGSFVFEENWDGNVINATGTWNFLGSVGKDKNKESIVLTINGVTGDPSNGHLFNRFSTEFTYRIKELKNKEINLVSNVAYYIDPATGRDNFDGDYTFVQ